MESQTITSAHSARASWMSLLAKAPGPVLIEAVSQYTRQHGLLPSYIWLRRPEIGLAMVRARTGGTGQQFNLGEMSLTRCALRLSSGQMGVSYVAGRDAQHAEWAALFDALMQGDAAGQVEQMVLSPIRQALAAQRALTESRAAVTKVDFMTMVRGENE
ncbi:phosphonate C-P lyase system protein PhnG [Glaciimonas sp. CA11.2]|uniref:phosphonate C-P lyase system protein PhnG n=1 Tax=unclassified Glaciimonas TaxID=2644401 RepID=UPI002AB41799|nr:MULTISPECIES: phosphonate C-P lyase system protein PhnG [unclassified Glaciimonas]MDY7546321.1 phosphonate C-P lyase system protein PhnG [Glaciimonas sp. CA11.2]MEB0010730.1 phosphonate C-P lyase system protein PhnG [Glaciimonas sp. Cout2]MEB0082134.1 phosphonate C-P lyase system protein PhnG [Glaciimonas sp. Gout2]MEB0161770.1 phosphonate C-P lyase system protein PhnG [Glaciimonas sp. CA11.2]